MNKIISKDRTQMNTDQADERMINYYKNISVNHSYLRSSASNFSTKDHIVTKGKQLFCFFFLFISILFWGCGGKLTAPPDVEMPSNLKLEPKINDSTVKLTWDYITSSDDTISFILAKKTGATSWYEFYATISTKIFIDNINTSDSLIYAYKVRAYNQTKNEFSSYSNIVAYFSEITKPTDLIITQPSQFTLQLNWQDNCEGEEGYVIDKKIGNDNWENSYKILGSDSHSFEDSTLLFEPVSYRVSAFTGDNSSEPAQNQIIPNLMAPTNLQLSVLDNNKIEICWNDSSSNEDGFLIDRKIGEQDWIQDLITIPSNTTSYVDDITFPCGTFAYRVRAFHVENDTTFYSCYSNEEQINIHLNLTGSIGTVGNSNQVFVLSRNSFERYAFIADNYNGLVVTDCVNPSSPSLVTTFPLPDRTISVFANENYAYATNRNGGFNIIDITNIDSLNLVESCQTAGVHNDVVISDGFAFIADGEIGLSVIIVSGPPHLITSLDVGGDAKSLCIQNNYAYVATGLNGGLAVVDISDVQNPAQVGNLPFSGTAQDIFVEGNYAYLANGESGLEIIDISDPNNPTSVSNCQTGVFAKSVQAQGNYIFIADTEVGLIVVDVSEPTNPFILGIYEMITQPNSICLSGSYAFLSDNDGLKIVQISP
ncbi:MAG: hypothetical protein U9P79_04125 [Candidatus Cloacimonadota bacterium]|nr:hypothetical protein [Candidatus Cloacimonadota bacterium]